MDYFVDDTKLVLAFLLNLPKNICKTTTPDVA